MVVRLLLASRSPRRAELLMAAGFEFDVAPAAELDESRAGDEAPEAYVVRLAEAKAAHVSSRNADRCVIGADTAVVVFGRVLGKPRDDADAVEMLRLLSGHTHRVLTGVAVHAGERRAHAVDTTLVRVARLHEEEIAWYVSTAEPRDKAGAYAIQGLASRFVTAIEGSYTNVVGLPIPTLCRLLRVVTREAQL